MQNEVQLDREWLGSLCSAGTDFLKDLLWLFRDQTHSYLRLLNSTSELPGNSALGDLTHKLKGSASSLGLRRLAAMSQEFENAVRLGAESHRELKKRAESLMAEIVAGESAVEHYIEEIEKR